MKAKKRKLTKKMIREAELLFHEWRSRLHLLDWKIHLNLLEDAQMDAYLLEDDEELNGELGTCQPMMLRKEAIVHLRAPNSVMYGKYDTFEATLVHELVHIHFCMVQDDFLVQEEQNVETITRALLELKYGNK